MNFCPRCATALHSKLIDGEERRLCPNESCGYVHWNNPIPVAAGLIEIDQKFLLARNVSWPPGFFSLISGFIETGETPQQTIHREAGEELGVTALSSQLLGHWPFPQQNQLLTVYHVQVTGEIVLNHELCEYQLLDRDRLLNQNFGPNRLMEWVVEQLRSN